MYPLTVGSTWQIFLSPLRRYFAFVSTPFSALCIRLNSEHIWMMVLLIRPEDWNATHAPFMERKCELYARMDRRMQTGWTWRREWLLAVGQALDLFLSFYPPHAATHTRACTHMHTGPWGMFSPEVAICTCLFGMQRALPPIPLKPVPSKLFVALPAFT